MSKDFTGAGKLGWDGTSKFTISGRSALKQMLDVQLDWLYDISFDEKDLLSILELSGDLPLINAQLASHGYDVEKTVGFNDSPLTLADVLASRCRDVTIPKVKIEGVEDSWFGMTQVFAGKATMPHDADFQFVESNDQLTGMILEAWRKVVWSSERGVSAAAGKKIVGDRYSLPYLDVFMYRGDGKALPKKWRFTNIFCTGTSSMNLGYEKNSKVMVGGSFKFDEILDIGAGLSGSPLTK